VFHWFRYFEIVFLQFDEYSVEYSVTIQSSLPNENLKSIQTLSLVEVVFVVVAKENEKVRKSQ